MKDWIVEFGSTICHQMPERCLTVSGYIMPLCVRCFSWYIGAIVSMIFLASYVVHTKRRFHFSLSGMIVLGVALLAMPVDGVSQAIGLRESTNWLRILTGALFGCVNVLGVWSAYSFTLKGSKAVGVLGAVKWIVACICGFYMILGLSVVPVVQPLGLEIMTVLAYVGGVLCSALGICFLYVLFFKKLEV